MNLPPFYAKSDANGQALWWIIRLEAGDMSDAEYRVFREWWLSDSQHGEALAAQTGWWSAFENALTPHIRARCAAVMRDKSRSSWRRPRFMKLAAAAALLIAIVGGWFALRNAGVVPQAYATHTGQYRTVTFADGSVAYLNTRTQLEWLGGMGSRRVALLSGEALFNVAADPARPFRVIVDRSEIRVLGTRFNVHWKTDGEVVVTVVEGTVEVKHEAGWQRILTPNQQVAYRPAGAAPHIRQADSSRVIQWREGVLTIKNEPLFDALTELARYTDQRMVADDPQLRSLRVTATLPVRDARRALNHLEHLAAITVVESRDAFTVTHRNPDKP